MEYVADINYNSKIKAPTKSQQENVIQILFKECKNCFPPVYMIHSLKEKPLFCCYIYYVLKMTMVESKNVSSKTKLCSYS